MKKMAGLSPCNPSISFFKTLIFNIHAFGVKGIWLHPVIVYHNTKICNVGKIEFTCPIKYGIVRIGQYSYKSQGVTKFSNRGIIRIGGPVVICGCTILENYGEIDFAGFDLISDGSYVLIRKHLKIGAQVSIGFHSFIMDSDDHFALNVADKSVSANTRPITIGNYNWFGAHTYVKKGTITPDFTTVASANTLLAKDYTAIKPYSVLGGIPAKVIGEGCIRIFSFKHERMLSNYFTPPTADAYQFPDEMSIEDICKCQIQDFFTD